MTLIRRIRCLAAALAALAGALLAFAAAAPLGGVLARWRSRRRPAIICPASGRRGQHPA
jgi:uncharacterized SAM-binding protein YcdF (DUF218 family)